VLSFDGALLRTQWPADVLVASGWILATALIAGATRVPRPSNAP
jgi:hypothetical protein